RLVGAGLSRVGVVYPKSDSAFITTLVAAIASKAAGRGLQLVLRPSETHDPAIASTLVEALVSEGAEAVLLVPPYAEMLGQASRERLQIPFAGLVCAEAISGMATVRIDNQSAAYALTKNLIDLGRRRIGVLVGPRDHSDSLARLEGHKAALEDHGLIHDPALEADGDFSFVSGMKGARRLIEAQSSIDAIVASNDEMAAGVLWVAQTLGRRVPDDLAVCGFDDTLLATRVWPALTTVRQPLDRMAGHALDALKTAFRNRGWGGEPVDLMLDYELIERNSTR
ncbi:hypothetical protein LTR94_028406, partial [Friedmanniomyces endolithicus]